MEAGAEFGFYNLINAAGDRRRERESTDLARVVVPQLLVQAVGMSFPSLDLSDDIKNL